MIECTSCHTLNPDAERVCLACGAALSRAAQTLPGGLGMVRCPAGHPIDPAWKSCPYCDRLQTGDVASQPQRTRLDADPEGTARLRRTRLEGEPAAPEPASPAPPAGPRPTRLEEPAGPPAARRTVLQESSPAPAAAPGAPEPAPGASGPAAPAASASALPVRRLLAVLAAPDCGPGGTVFPVRGGKNVIGTDRASDIALSGDSEVSGEHAVILHRNGAFHLADRLSTNGTWLNGREVPANGTVPLRDRDRLRCGRTELVFLVIEPAEGLPVGEDNLPRDSAG